MQRHSEEICHLAGTVVAVPLIETYGPPERFGGVESDSLAISGSQFGLGTSQQSFGDATSLPFRQNRHPSQVTFAAADDGTGDGPEGVTGFSHCDQHTHRAETLLNCFRRKDRVRESVRRVASAVWLESRPEAFEDSRFICYHRFADCDCAVQSNRSSPKGLERNCRRFRNKEPSRGRLGFESPRNLVLFKRGHIACLYSILVTLPACGPF